MPFGEGEGAEEGHIHILESGPTEGVAAKVAEGKDRWRGKSGGVEAAASGSRACAPRARACIRITNEVRTVYGIPGWAVLTNVGTISGNKYGKGLARSIGVDAVEPPVAHHVIDDGIIAGGAFAFSKR